MIERERKFRVDALPDDLGPPSHIDQGYLAVDGAVEVRVRRADDRCTMTVKAGTGRDRTEVEVDLDEAAFEELWPLTDGRRVVKDRHRVPLDGGLTAEVDRYCDHLDGLVVVEVELEDPDGFRPPPWFGPELTGDHRWSNAALAEADHPPGEPLSHLRRP